MASPSATKPKIAYVRKLKTPLSVRSSGVLYASRKGEFTHSVKMPNLLRPVYVTSHDEAVRLAEGNGCLLVER